MSARPIILAPRKRVYVKYSCGGVSNLDTDAPVERVDGDRALIWMGPDHRRKWVSVSALLAGETIYTGKSTEYHPRQYTRRLLPKIPTHGPRTESFTVYLGPLVPPQEDQEED